MIDYYDIDRVSASRLSIVKALDEGKPIHKAKPETLEFGKYFHAYLLEPEMYLSANTFHEKVRAMGESAKKNVLISYLLSCKQAKKEQDIFFTHERTDQLCKLKADIVLGNIGYDLKSTAFQTRQEFEEACLSYGYHRQAAFYLMGAKLKRFTFIGVCKTYPYNTYTFEMNIDDERVMKGMVENEILLDKHKLMVERGIDFKRLMKAA